MMRFSFLFFSLLFPVRREGGRLCVASVVVFMPVVWDMVVEKGQVGLLFYVDRDR